jgi:hypothetical protein
MNPTFRLPSKGKLYLLCQLGGWGMYFITMTVLLYVYRNPHFIARYELASNAFLCLTGLILTHLFRLVLKEFQWESLSLLRQALLVFLLILMMAVINTTAARQANFWFNPEPEKLMYGDLMLLMVNNTTLFLFWSGIYFGIAFFRRYRKEEIERLQWESALKEFELNKLKSQLNPHFVFNALNGIRSLVEEDPGKSKTAITQLSNILRNSLLSDRAQTIPLSEEINTVLDYLNLEKIRFEERLRFELELEPGSLKTQVPPMMIQTLVENAVKHGISKQISGGLIRLESKSGNGKLLISIENCGNLAKATGDGYGILNTTQRLELIFGKEAGFSISQKNDNTVIANIEIPIA